MDLRAYWVYTNDPNDGAVHGANYSSYINPDELKRYVLSNGKRKLLAIEPKPNRCVTGDHTYNAVRVELIRRGEVPGAVYYVLSHPVTQVPAPVAEPAKPGPRKPPPALPPEIHRTVKFDPVAAWEATKIAAKGGVM